MLKIWGRTNSINVQKVLWCAGELGLEFERIDFGGEFGGTDPPEYRAMNPMGLIPTIDDDGVILWESHSCVRYLAAKNDPGGLWPDDVSVRAEAEKWMDWILASVNQPMGLVFRGLIRTPEAERDMAVIGAAKEQMKCFWASSITGLRIASSLRVTAFPSAISRLGPMRFAGSACSVMKWPYPTLSPGSSDLNAVTDSVITSYSR